MAHESTDIGLADVQAAYAATESDISELIMGEQVHIGGLISSQDLCWQRLRPCSLVHSVASLPVMRATLQKRTRKRMPAPVQQQRSNDHHATTYDALKLIGFDQERWKRSKKTGASCPTAGT